jgi:hypothetical protein
MFAKKASGWFLNTFNNSYVEFFNKCEYLLLLLSQYLQCNTLGDKADLLLHFTCHIILQFQEQLSQSRVCCKEQKTRESGAAESKAVDIYQSLCCVADMR